MKLKSIAFFWVSMSSLLVASCKQRSDDSELQSAGRRVGSFKGLAAVETTIKGRIMLPNSYFDLAQYLGDSSEDGLPSLLGAYDGRPGSSSLQNATPNAVNTMLWQIVMDGAASAIATKACSGGNELETHFKQAAKKICDWPTGADDRAQTLREFWLDLMRYDAPQAEMEAWVGQMTASGGSVATLQGQALVKDLTQSILMNPFFLLEQ